MVKRTLYILLIFVLFAGCSTVKQGWKNFTAYYNTFYNANQFYDAGLERNLRQVPQINPLLPIRVHLPPSSAGLDEFEQAIERGSSILRNHDESKYVLPAIFLIGKSFYYRAEYFSALEKFQELQTLASGTLQQEATLWQGRTYLEMSNFNEGIRFLEVEADLIEDWDPALRAETDMILAQLHTALRNWGEAASYLNRSIEYVEDRHKKARAFFLLGQVNERLGDYSQALYAYNQISGIRTTYDIEFNALRKEAEVSRMIGNYQRAEYLYRSMQRDDKFFEYRNELQYEIARTYQLRGMPETALDNYQLVLRDRRQNPSPVTQARSFFGIGEIYRDDLDSFTMAAAYFDSAASVRVDQALLPVGFNARELAESFGQYADIRREISHRDSLLRVANLPPDELEALIAELQRIEEEKMQEEMSRMQSERDRMIVAEPADTVIDAAEATTHGFLNINNPAMLQDASLQFQAIWGDRALADNWRRRADVSATRFDQIVIRDESDEVIEIEPESAEGGLFTTAVDLSDIPFEQDEKLVMKKEIEDLNYRLANVFFLSLDMPDSARAYYQKVTESSFNEHLVTMAFYSIAEIELLRDNEASARDAFDSLYQKDPNSLYTRRIADRLNVEIELTELTEIPRIEQQYFEVRSNENETPPKERAEALLMLAENGNSDSQRARLLFEAAQEYMKAARFESDNQQIIREWFERQDETRRMRTEFQMLQDSSQVMLADTTIAEDKQLFWQNIADSTFAEPNFTEGFPFEGAYWDTTRSILNRIEQYYATSTIMPSVTLLQQTLRKPVIQQPEEEMLIDPEIEEFIPDTAESLISTCEELGISMDFDGGMDAFMRTISFPSWTESISMRGEVVYTFTIAPDGTVIGYDQVSQMDRSGIPQSIENAIDQLLIFTPHEEDMPVRCNLTFPIDL
ncbi:MAG: tetratricopeptide repeat protein [Balneolaceae bacterium]|nr:MAG: tetratricopeptide repeat protein [Balneolaceae bacterium]